jgi:glycosyltransferase involved in cell wall biosynthesis
MDLLVTTSQRFYRTPDRLVWVPTIHAYSFWTRYLDVFDRVCVVGRICDVPDIPPDWRRAEGDGVVFVEIPNHLGPHQYLLKARQVRRAIQKAFSSAEAVILRAPSHISNLIEPRLYGLGHPFGLEVIGDPYDGFAPGSVKHFLRPFFRWWFTYHQKRQCQHACAVAYVTKEALQKRYPRSPSVFSTYYSSIELGAEDLVCTPRQIRQGQQSFVLITVVTLTHLHKATNILIDAIHFCLQHGLDIRLVIVGDGRYRPQMERQVESLSLGERVVLLGQVPPGRAVRAELDKADLFVLPSYQEGLPRALIEAMARGLPSIGSNVGGFPELLPAEDMVPPGDSCALARKIEEVLTDPERMACMSVRNLTTAKEYQETIIRERRFAFYQEVRDRTSDWQIRRTG